MSVDLKVITHKHFPNGTPATYMELREYVNNWLISQDKIPFKADHPRPHRIIDGNSQSVPVPYEQCGPYTWEYELLLRVLDETSDLHKFMQRPAGLPNQPTYVTNPEHF